MTTTGRCLVTILLAAALAPPVGAAEGGAALQPLAGKWKAMMSFAGSGGQFTVTLAEDARVTQPDPNTIAFSMKPVTSATPVFDTRLSYDTATKSYLLGVKATGGPVVERLKLGYAAGTGFSGEGSLNDTSGKTHAVQVRIKPKEDGGYEWTVVDPSAPPENNIVFGFTFLRRLP